MIPRCYLGIILTILLCHFTCICHCSSNCDRVLISQAIYPSSMTNILTFTFVRTSCAQNCIYIITFFYSLFPIFLETTIILTKSQTYALFSGAFSLKDTITCTVAFLPNDFRWPAISASLAGREYLALPSWYSNTYTCTLKPRFLY